MHGNEWMHGWCGMWFGPLLTWGVPILLIVLSVWFLRGFSGSSAGSGRELDPKLILDQRFARGDVNEEEYRRRLNELGGRKTD